MIVPDWSGTIPVVNGNADSARTVYKTSGGEPSLAWSTNSTLEDGEEITVITDNTFDFGVKSQAAPKLVVRGSTVIENGVVRTDVPEFNALQGAPIAKKAIDASSMWSRGEGCLIDKNELPHANIDQMYRAEKIGWLGWADAFNGETNYPHDKLYVSWKIKSEVNISRLKSITYTGSITGTFDTGLTDFDLGEAVTITRSDLSTGTGTIVSVDLVNSRINVVSADQSTDFAGATVVGNVSGASVETTIDLAGSSTKYLRAWEETSSSVDQIAPVYSSLGQFFADAYQGGSSIERKPVSTSGAPNPCGDTTFNQWHQIEASFDYSGALGTGFVRMDNSGKKEFTDLTLATKSATGGPNIANLGFENNIPDRVNAAGWFGDIYADDTHQKIVLGNAPTWDAVTVFEVSVPTVWEAGLIKANLYKGALTSIVGSYIYVFNTNSDSPENTNGVLI